MPDKDEIKTEITITELSALNPPDKTFTELFLGNFVGFSAKQSKDAGLQSIVTELMEGLSNCTTQEKIDLPTNHNAVQDTYFRHRNARYRGRYKEWSKMDSEEKAFHLVESAERLSYRLTERGVEKNSAFPDIEEFRAELLQRLQVVNGRLKSISQTTKNSESKEQPDKKNVTMAQVISASYTPLSLTVQVDDLIEKLQATKDIEHTYYPLTTKETTPWCQQVLEIICNDFKTDSSELYNEKYSEWDNRPSILITQLEALLIIAQKSYAEAEQYQVIITATQHFQQLIKARPASENDPIRNCLVAAIQKTAAAMQNNKIGIILRDEKGLFVYRNGSYFARAYHALADCMNGFILSTNNRVEFDDASADVDETIREAISVEDRRDFTCVFVDYLTTLLYSEELGTSERETALNSLKDLRYSTNQNHDQQVFALLVKLPNFDSLGKFETKLQQCLRDTRILAWQPITSAHLKSEQNAESESKMATPKFNLYNALTDLIEKIEIAKKYGGSEMERRAHSTYADQALTMLHEKLNYTPTNKLETLFNFIWSKPSEEKPALRPIDVAYAALRTTVATARDKLKQKNHPTFELQLEVMQTIAEDITATLQRIWELRPREYDDARKRGGSVDSIIAATEKVIEAIKNNRISINPRDQHGTLLAFTEGSNKTNTLLDKALDAFTKVIDKNAFKVEEDKVAARKHAEWLAGLAQGVTMGPY